MSVGRVFVIRPLTLLPFVPPYDYFYIYTPSVGTTLAQSIFNNSIHLQLPFTSDPNNSIVQRTRIAMSNEKRNTLEQLVRRRIILTRISTARNSVPLHTPERARLEEACKKAVVSLAETASSVLQSDMYCTSFSSDDSLLKWRTRLTRELSSLRCALFHLSDAKHSLSSAIAENVGENVRYNPRGKSFSIGRHCNTAASHLEKARSVCAYVRREISDQLSMRLQSSRKNISLEAHTRISEVYGKVNRFETQAIEQLAILAAAEAEMVVCGTHSHTTTRLNMTRSASSSSSEMEIGTSCTRDSQLPHVKRALCLLMTLA